MPFLTACGTPRAPKPEKWETGFWFWDGSSAAVAPLAEPVDVIYFQAGTIRMDNWGPRRGEWTAYGSLPDPLPRAKQYWMVFRLETEGVPPTEAAAKVAAEAAEVAELARWRNLPLAGIQLDIDSPTAALERYALFLAALRKDLPPGLRISITALLDWFRKGTAVEAVLAQVEEYVPQFYDIGGEQGHAKPGIAAAIDGARWGPVFDGYGKPYRIGISVFGRSRMVPRPPPTGAKYLGIPAYGDLRPLDVALDPAFDLQSTPTAAGELVLTYKAKKATRIGYSNLDAGDAYEFIVPTPESIRTAFEQARSMRRSKESYCAGVLFFRWPSSGEILAMYPDEVLAAAGAKPPDPRPAILRATDGECAVVHCKDLYLSNLRRLAPQPLTYRIDSSAAFEYFVPREGVPARMAGPALIEVTLPPYAGVRRMHLGRAVAAKAASYTLREAP